MLWETINRIYILAEQFSLELLPSILFAVFIYKTLTPEQKPKYGIVGTVVLYVVCSALTRVVFGEYGIAVNDKIHTVIMSTYIYVLTLCLFYGERKKIIIRITAVIAMEIFLEYLTVEIIWIVLRIDMLSEKDDFASSHPYLGKLLFIPIMYICFVIWDMYRQKNREKRIKNITFINFIIGLVQFLVSFKIIEKYYNIFEKNAYIVTIISSTVMLVGYFLVTEVFKEILVQQEKESELEKIKMECRYQYDYYQLAQKQGEEIRDIRHDLRNQIQIVQYLVKSGEDKAGREMLMNIKKKVNHLE